MLLFVGAGLISANRTNVKASAQNASAIFAGDAIPIVPPMPHFHAVNMIITSPQTLDGFDCEGCGFKDAELRYGGGPFDLRFSNFSGTTHITLTGAAANTLALLTFFDGIQKGIPAAPSIPDQPIKKKITAKKPMTGLSLTPPFIGQR